MKLEALNRMYETMIAGLSGAGLSGGDGGDDGTGAGSGGGGGGGGSFMVIVDDPSGESFIGEEVGEIGEVG